MIVNSACSGQADYSAVMGERILPFVFSLDEEESVLNPSPGEYQRFCYEITGVGQDTSRYADLSHFLLGVCPSITREEIAEITVSINDDPQTVVWGENVEIKAAENPDPLTGCSGLKFDFPLNKQVGILKVCISLRRPYPVGPVNICLYGGGTAASGLAICGPACGGGQSCESVFYQQEMICVPVEVTPFARPGTAKAVCCGEPAVQMGAPCSGTQTSCSFTITQRLCIEIPISFGAVIETGTASVQCGDASQTPCDCTDSVPETAARSGELKERRLFGYSFPFQQ